MVETAVRDVIMHRQQRALIGRLIEGLTDPSLCDVPAGHNNNILWNLGHIVVSQQQLIYLLSNRDMYVPDDLIAMFRQGTSPADWHGTPDIGEIKTLLHELPDRFEEDVKSGSFGDYRGYTTSTGLELVTFEDGVAFNHFHEGVHAGIIMSLKKLVVD